MPARAWAVLAVMAGGASLEIARLGADAGAAVNALTVVIVAILLAYGPRRHDPLNRTRRLLLAALGAAFAAAMMSVVYEIATGHPPGHPWVGDAVSFLYVPCTVAGLLMVPAASQRTGYRARAGADALLAMSCLWYLVAGFAGSHFGAQLAHGGAAATAGLITAAGDVCVVAVALAVLSRCAVSVVLTVGGIAGGVTMIAVNDIWLLLSGGDPYGSTAILIFQSGLLLFVAAAALPAPQKPTTVERLRRVRAGLGVAPFVPLLVCIGVHYRDGLARPGDPAAAGASRGDRRARRRRAAVRGITRQA